MKNKKFNTFKHMSLIATMGYVGQIWAIDVPNKTAMENIKQTFQPSQMSLTVNQKDKSNNNNTNMIIKISNKWELSFNSTKSITITKILLTANNNNLVNNVDLKLQAKHEVGYYFSDKNLVQVIDPILSGKKFLGIYENIQADSFIDFDELVFKKIKITIDYQDENKSFYQLSKDFILVAGK